MLSAIILAKNEEKTIQQAIASVKFADEIIVGDDGSVDKTQELAQRNGVKIIKLTPTDDFSQKRNELAKKAKYEWLFFLDADEEVSKELAQEIKDELKNPRFFSYYIKRRDFFWGREMRYGEVSKVRNKGLVRLMKKDSGVWQGKVHEVFTSYTSSGCLNNFINHYPHPTLKDFLQKVNFYSTLRAKELLSKGKKTNILEIIFFPLGKFLLNYFVYAGFLDGPAGFVYAFLMSFYSFLVRGKLWELQK
jgi:glycosyltransferase involved in cell wall biosynthesis